MFAVSPLEVLLIGGAALLGSQVLCGDPQHEIELPVFDDDDIDLAVLMGMKRSLGARAPLQARNRQLEVEINAVDKGHYQVVARLPVEGFKGLGLGLNGMMQRSLRPEQQPIMCYKSTRLTVQDLAELHSGRPFLLIGCLDIALGHFPLVLHVRLHEWKQEPVFTAFASSRLSSLGIEKPGVAGIVRVFDVVQFYFRVRLASIMKQACLLPGFQIT